MVGPPSISEAEATGAAAAGRLRESSTGTTSLPDAQGGSDADLPDARGAKARAGSFWVVSSAPACSFPT